MRAAGKSVEASFSLSLSNKASSSQACMVKVMGIMHGVSVLHKNVGSLPQPATRTTRTTTTRQPANPPTATASFLGSFRGCLTILDRVELGFF